ncbi:MAG TPA: 50S ribosomal protein L18 [bacterium]|nr:50S ribosomal protein L18 [bacterium]HPL95665.1 50S ribosomal protein L18 [bacterium]
MNQQKIKQQKKQLRHARTRAKIFGTALKPRLSVFKSLRHTSAQLIDDQKGHTLVSVSHTAGASQNNITKTDHARTLGELLAKKALAQKITTCVFDKGSYKYHGRIKALADGARAAGLKF